MRRDYHIIAICLDFTELQERICIDNKITKVTYVCGIIRALRL